MTLNGVMALILRYFTECRRFRGALRKVVEDVVAKKFMFAISYPDEFLVLLLSLSAQKSFRYSSLTILTRLKA